MWSVHINVCGSWQQFLCLWWEMFRAVPLLPCHTSHTVPFGATEPKKKEENSELLGLSLSSGKFVPEDGKMYFHEMMRPVFCGLVTFFCAALI